MGQELAAAGAFASIPALLARNVKEFGDRPAYREKEFGIWQTWTWAETEKEIEALALGLINLGVNEGDFVMVLVEGEGAPVAERRNIEMGRQVEGGVIVHSGLEKDDAVITQGLQRVRNGMSVRIQPAAESTPVSTVLLLSLDNKGAFRPFFVSPLTHKVKFLNYTSTSVSPMV